MIQPANTVAGDDITYSATTKGGTAQSMHLPMQTNSFGNLTARYIEFTAEDNYFGGQLPGGDRIGMREVSFSATIPEPSIGMLGLLSLVAIGLRRRR